MDLAAWLEFSGGRLVTGLLIFARFGGVFMAAPLTSSRTVPHATRVGLSAALAMVLTPLAPSAAVESFPLLVAGLVKEVLFGLALGWIATLLFASVQIAGEWLDVQAGFQIAQVLNPAFDTQNGLMGSFKYMLAGLVFFGTGGHAMLIRGAAGSLAVSPPGVLRLGLGGVEEWTGLLVRVFWIAVQLAAPVAAALFLAEIAIALMSRALPQVHLMILTLPMKALLAVCAVALTLPLLARVLAAVFARLGPEMVQLLRAMGN